MEELIPEIYVKLIKEFHRNMKTRDKTVTGTTENFEVKFGYHQGSALPLSL